MSNYFPQKTTGVITYPWASYQIRKIEGCACAGNAGNVFPRRRFLREPLVSDPGMHHGTCVTHVPWCMPGSLTCGDGENVPGIPGACASAILRIWQEAHGIISFHFCYQMGPEHEVPKQLFQTDMPPSASSTPDYWSYDTIHRLQNKPTGIMFLPYKRFIIVNAGIKEFISEWKSRSRVARCSSETGQYRKVCVFSLNKD